MYGKLLLSALMIQILYLVFTDSPREVSAQMDYRGGTNSWPLNTYPAPLLLLALTQRDSSRILRDLPGVLQKVSCMLLNAGYLIIQVASVSSINTSQIALCLEMLSSYEKVSTLRVELSPISFQIPQVLAQYTRSQYF